MFPRLPTPVSAERGACVFVQSPDQVIDCGVSLGMGTNNSAELHALGVCLAAVLSVSLSHPHVKRAMVFSDSKLAINAATSVRLPLTNSNVTHALRAIYAKLITKLAVSLHRIPGHAGIGGNERVNKISKSFAHGVVTTPVAHVDFSSSVSRSEWFFFPLCGVSIKHFVSNLPVPPLNTMSGLVTSSATNSTVSVAHILSSSNRVQLSLSWNESNEHSSAIDGREPSTAPDLRTLRRSARLQSATLYHLPDSVVAGLVLLVISRHSAALEKPISTPLQSPRVKSTRPSNYSDELDHKHCD